MPRWALYLLGPPRLECDGLPIHIKRRKTVALLAYLAVNGAGKSHSREGLVTLLSPELDPSRARATLRRCLSDLNQVLDDKPVIADRETVVLDPRNEIWVDVNEFCQRLAECDLHDHHGAEACADCLSHLEAAVTLYGDDFMAGFALRDSLAFDEWQFFQTEALHDQLAGALVRLARYHTSQGDFETAIAYARRWLAVDPTREPAHQHLMALYAQSGQRAAALRQYDVCRRTLGEELGVEPSAKIQEMYERLAAGDSVVGPSAVEAVLERALRTVGPCPYRGLAAFRETDAPFFFGREGFVAQLFQAVHERSLVAVIVGSSGSGKSSTVYAGLLPRLREEGAWLIADLRPGGRPYDALAAAVLLFLEPALSETDRLIETRKLAGALREGRVLLSDVVGRTLAKNPGAQRLLLLVDQFEELYTLCPEPETRRRFLDALLSVVKLADRARSTRFGLLITLRADFMDQALTHRAFADTLQTAALMMGPMTRDELQAAIEKPAQKQGAGLEAGLVERLLDDVGEEPGNLPLLEFALTLLWERLDYGWMTHAAYEGIGHVEGALARYADGVYAELDEDEQERARQIFVQLVQPGEGTQDTRRVARRVELGDINWALVQYLADKRLVVTGRDVTTGEERVEVVHEALIQRWGRLRHWMEEDRAFRTWQERLRSGMRGWEASGRDDGALLRGVPLVEAESWLVQRGDELGQAEREYIHAGVDLRQRRQAEREQRRRRTVLALAGGLVLAVALALFALAARKQARSAEQDALRQASAGLAAQALAELEGALPERSVLLALEALERYPYTPQAESSLAQVLNLFTSYEVLEGPGPRWLAAEWSPDGTLIAARGNYFESSWVGIWDVTKGKHPVIKTVDRIPGCEQFDLAWSPDGTRLVTSARSYTPGEANCGAVHVFLLDQPSPYEIHGHSGNTNTVDWSPDGSVILTAGEDGTFRLWEANTGVLFLAVQAHDAAISEAAWAPNGKWIATVSRDGTAKAWAIAAVMEAAGRWTDDSRTDINLEAVTFTGHAGALTSLAWSPDSSRLATAGTDGVVRVALLPSGNDGVVSDALFALVGHSEEVVDVDWAPDGKRLASASQDGTVRVWDAHNGAELLTLRGVVGGGQSVAWSPASDRLVVSGSFNQVRVWDVSGQSMRLPAHEIPVTDARWSPDGSQIATVSGGDGSIRIWNADSGVEIRRIDASASLDWVYLDWSPDGTRVLTTDEYRSITIWDVLSGELVMNITGNFFAAAWSPDGARIVGVDWPQRPLVYSAVTGWPVAMGSEVGCEGPDQAFSWSPDGDFFVGNCMASANNPSRIWNAATGKLLLELPSQHGSSVWAEWSPIGDRIAVGYDQGVCKVWDVSEALETGASMAKDVVTFFGDTDVVWRVTWSPNGSRLASAGESGMVRVWEADTGAEVMRFRAPDFVTAVDWSPDGHYLIASGGFEVPMIQRVWQSTEELIADAKECCVWRELTPEERVQFGLPER